MKVSLALAVTTTTCLIASSLGSANAAVLGYDGMNYPDPPTTAGSGLESLNGGTGWTAAWTANNDGFKTNPTGGLSYGSLATSTGEVRDTGSTSPANQAYFRQTAGADLNDVVGNQVRWFSVLLNVDSLTTPTAAQAGTRAMHIGLADSTGSATSLSTNVGLSVLATATGGYELAARFRTTESTSRVALDFDETLLLVGKYSQNDGANDFVELWVNPDNATLGGADITAVSTADGYASIANNNNNLDRGASAFVFNAAGSLGNTFTGVLDEVRVGDTYAEVTPIPEPASLLLVAAGLGLAVSRRRSA